MDDIELINEIVRDKNKFRLVIERFEKPLRRYVGRLLYLSANEIDDILQDTFISIYKNMNQYNAKYSLSSWIYRIAHNTSISHLRKNKKHIGISLTPEELDRIPDDENIELSKDLSTYEVNRIINKLGDKYKEVLILRFIENKSYKEISDILKISIGTVGSLINRAISKLRKTLNNEKH